MRGGIGRAPLRFGKQRDESKGVAPVVVAYTIYVLMLDKKYRRRCAVWTDYG